MSNSGTRDERYRTSALTSLSMLQLGVELEALVQDGADEEDIISKIDELNLAIMAYDPGVVRKGTHDKDRKAFIRTAKLFLNLGRFDGLRLIVSQFFGIFHPDQKRYCGRLCFTCSTDKCVHRFLTVTDLICPVCDAPRQLCRKAPASTNGRCQEAGHGGYANTTKMLGKWNGVDPSNSGRVMAYGTAMLPSLKGAFEQLITDPDFLSMTGEIGILGARNVILLQQMEEVDVLEMEKELRTQLARIRTNIEKGKHNSALNAVAEIYMIIESSKDNQLRWSELKENIAIMAKLSDTERKRLVDAQQTITKAEMEMLLEVAATGMRTAVNNAGRQVYQHIARAVHSKLTPDEAGLAMGVFENMGLGRVIEDMMAKHISNAIATGRNVRQVEYEAEIIEGQVEDA